MKNILTIENGIAILLSNVDDGTNTIFINGEEIPASSWVGSGVYQYTESGVTFTIEKTSANTGNIMLQLIEGTAYRLVKQFEGEPYNSGDPLDTDLADEDYMPFYDASDGRRKNSLWSNIVAKIKATFTGVFWMLKDVTVIPASSSNVVDLNTYITPGNYACVADATSPYVNNQPLSTNRKAFNLIVIKNINSGSNIYFRQMLWYYNSNTLYSRYSVNGGTTWSEWLDLNKDSTKLPLVGGNMTGTLSFFTNVIRLFNGRTGTTSVVGQAYILVGNGAASGTEGNSQGFVRMFSDKASSVQLSALSDNTSNIYNQGLKPYNGTIPLQEVENLFSANQHIVKTAAAGTEGQSILYLGNGTAKASDNNSKGYLRLYSDGTGGTQLSSATGSSVVNQTLQAKAGTIALTSDISGTRKYTNLISGALTIAPGGTATVTGASSGTYPFLEVWAYATNGTRMSNMVPNGNVNFPVVKADHTIGYANISYGSGGVLTITNGSSNPTLNITNLYGVSVN